jgi:pimeloyl-ACP methyl ester carboxylesterase
MTLSRVLEWLEPSLSTLRRLFCQDVASASPTRLIRPLAAGCLFRLQATEKLIELGEFAVNCASLGSGEGLLMLHGSNHREDWRVWEPIFNLANGYKIVAPDMVGYGKSSRPTETPGYAVQAQIMKDLTEKISLGRTNVVGAGWGGQIALQFALEWPDAVKSLVLIASAYDKQQLPRLGKLRKPTLIIYAEDDMVTQLKAGYLLRDAIGTSRLEVLDPVARDPSHDFTISHRLQEFRPGQVAQLMRRFLGDPVSMLAEPPELENELRGMALRRGKEGAGDADDGAPKGSTRSP